MTAKCVGVAETNGLPASKKRSGQLAARVMPMREDMATSAGITIVEAAGQDGRHAGEEGA